MGHAWLSIKICACNVTLNRNQTILIFATSATLTARNISGMMTVEYVKKIVVPVSALMNISACPATTGTWIFITQECAALKNVEMANNKVTMSVMMVILTMVMAAVIIAK